MTTPNEDVLIGPQPRPSDAELAAQPTVKIPWQRPAPPRQSAPLLVAALINTLWAALLCLVAVALLIVLARVSLGQRPSGAEALVSVAGWLLAHGVPVKTGPVEITLAPLSITLLIAWRLNRAGVHTSRGIGARKTGSVPAALRVAAAVGLFYGAFGLLGAFAIDRAGIEVTWWRAGAHLAVIGTVAALLGSVRNTGALRTLARRTPMVIRDAVRTGVVAALFLLGAGAGVLGLSIALHGDTAARMMHGLPSGFAGQVGVTVLCLAFAPNFAIWAASYLLGPGFILRAGSLVSPGVVTTDDIPDRSAKLLQKLPVVAGLPGEALQGPGWAMLALPVLAGVGAGLLLVRRRLRPRRTRSGDVIFPQPRWQQIAFSATLAGPLGGLLIAAASFAGSGRLDDHEQPLGPVLWQAGTAAAIALGLGTLIGVAVAAAFYRRKH